MSNNDSATKINLKKQTNFTIFWTILVLCYIFVEWIFNQHLLDVMSKSSIDLDNFSKTILLGKIILSIGLNLIIKGIYQYEKWSKFILGNLIAFGALSGLYMQTVESFPAELQYASYYGTIFKQDAIQLKDKDKILNIEEKDGWYVKPLLLSHFMFTLDNRKWLEFQNRVTEPINREVITFIKNKNKNFTSYKNAEDARKTLDQSWKDVLEAKAKYEAVRYSKAKKPERKAALDEFRAKTGIEPSTTQEEFYKTNSKEYHRALTVQLFSGFADGGVSPIYVRDIPQDLDQEKFFNLVETKAKEMKTRTTPSMREIRDARNAPEIVKTFVLPPIMFALSIISIIFNILIIISMWVKLFGKKLDISKEVVMPIYFALTLFILAVGIIIKPTITSNYAYWNEQEQSLSSKYPGLALFWKLGLKLEPMLCITDKVPTLSKEITKYFYE